LIALLGNSFLAITDNCKEFPDHFPDIRETWLQAGSRMTASTTTGQFTICTIFTFLELRRPRAQRAGV